MSQDDKRKEIAKAKYIVSIPIQDIADFIGVSRRTIERWAETGKWQDLRSALLLTERPRQRSSASAERTLTRTLSQAGNTETQFPATNIIPLREIFGTEDFVPKISRPKPIYPTDETLTPRYTSSTGKTDDIQVVIAAIADLHATLPVAENKSKGGIAGAIARLVELKRKLQPETAADLAARAIELEITPDEFMQALKEAWQKIA